MPQQTNLNVAPYFDDFDASSDYHKVLFKPGYPVQARELTTLQSILQNQIEKFGNHFFKEGQRVIPGNVSYNQFYYAVKLNNNFQGIPVAAFAEQLVGKTISGVISGVSAVVDRVLLPSESEENTLTLYVNYVGSNTTNNSTQQFNDGEELTCASTLASGLLGNTTITPGTSFGLTLSNNNAATGSAFMINNGVYFIRGQFVGVDTETLILDQYNNTPNYRVGLNIVEEIINSDLDEDLNDNSQGFNNYGAPGADRLKVTASLFKKSLDDFDDNSFIELGTVKNGVLRSNKKTGSLDATPFDDEIATKLYDTEGDFTVTEFDSVITEALDDGLGNKGLFKEGEYTYGGQVVSNDNMVYKMSPGKAYVRGYDVEIPEAVFLDAPKSRTTKQIKDEAISYNTGTTLRLNGTMGSPVIGIGGTYTVSLRDKRMHNTSSDTQENYGKEIGVARVYDYKLERGTADYDFAGKSIPTNQFNLSLYDVQTVTELFLNQPITLNTPTYVKGKQSGATAFLKESTTDKNIVLYEQEGEFIPSESLIFNGVDDGRIAVAITEYGISDVRAVFSQGYTGFSTFSGDVVQKDVKNIGIASITAAHYWGTYPSVTIGNEKVHTGISTVSLSFDNPVDELFKKGDLVRFTNPLDTREKVIGVVSTTKYRGPNRPTVQYNDMEITNVAVSVGIAQSLPSEHITATDFTKINTGLQSSEDNTLYTPLPKSNVSEVDLSEAFITVRRKFSVNIDNGEFNSSTIPTAGEDEFFLPFDEERYSLFTTTGNPMILDSNKVTVFTDANGRSALKMQGFDSTVISGDCDVITTIQKKKPKAKLKIRNAVKSIIIDKSNNPQSGIGATTANDGLVYGAYPYGTRVQDDIISLNHPDIIELYGIYESQDTEDPTAPRLVLTNIASPSTTTSDFLVGDIIKGESSEAIAIIAEIIDAETITFLYKNDELFKEGERIKTTETNLYSTIQTVSNPSYNISENFTYDDGQQSSFYDYGYITRNKGDEAPSKKIKAYFCTASYNPTDTGDITTVESYKNFDFSNEIREVDGYRNTDIIDIRPRVDDYTVNDGATRSPLEFYGRTFDQAGNSATNILASDESIVATFSYYLGRIDRIFLNKDGTFQINYGQPSDNPEFPNPVDDALEVCQATLPPYVYDVSEVSINFLSHKGYKNIDIKKLEDRIQNLEYYTALSLLETNTNNMFVADRDGSNRFKAGFFVDNFATFSTQEEQVPIKNSIDQQTKQLRPKHYTTSVDLIFGPVVDSDPTEDLDFADIEGVNVKKLGDAITLDYSEVEWLKQSFGTRTESVTPFMIPFWQGSIELTPAGDTWVDTVRIGAKIINQEGNFAQTMATASRLFNVNPQSGFAPTVWNSWATTWTGMDANTWSRQSSTVISNQRGLRQGRREFERTRTRVTRQTLRQDIQVRRQSRTGTRTLVVEDIQNTSQGTRIVSRDLSPSIRSRNITFDGQRFKPNKRLYAFFDGKDVTKYCVPKLLEISMTTGVFQVGETVIGESSRSGQQGSWPNQNIPSIAFRVATANHKKGIYSSPTSTYQENPYTTTVLSSAYSGSSTVLNIDLYSLSNHPQGQFSGWVEEDMILRGQSSGAQARVTNVRLIPGLMGIMQGSLFIPNPNNTNHPRFETGTKVFTLIDNKNNIVKGADTRGEEEYVARGFVNTIQETILSVRNARIEHRATNDNRTTRTMVGSAQVVNTTSNIRTTERTIRWHDPLAQSILVDDESGIYLTRCDVFFKSKDDMHIPVTMQIRSTEKGYPLQKIVPFSEISLQPEEVVLSSDGSVATSFQFKAPVYLEGGKEYALALLSNSTKYSVFISRVGEEDLLTRSYVSQQPYLGSLFKSQNASTWEPSQWEDLKFTLYRADFVNSGTVELYNPELTKGNGQEARLIPDSLSLVSNQVKVGLGTTVADDTIEFGNTITQVGTQASGDYVGTAGSITGLFSTRIGVGYTPQSGGSQNYTNVSLVTLSGEGKGAVINLTVLSGSPTNPVVVDGGKGYKIGDVVTLAPFGNEKAGEGNQMTITTVGASNQIVLDNVQGTFETAGVGKTVMVTRSNGITTGFNDFNGGDVQISSIDTVTDGLHIKVNHENHGMNFQNNIVSISGAQSDLKPTRLSAPYSVDSTEGISVNDSTIFKTFEGVGVGTTNRGYLSIGDEVIEYSNVTGNVIGGFIARGTNAVKQDYPVGTEVFKYELGGVNLKRVNKSHSLQDSDAGSDGITFDSYKLKIDMSEKFNVENANRSNDDAYPALHFNRTQSAGGDFTYATQNIPFEIITPMIQNFTPKGTTLSATMKTVTGQSMSGVETPWVNYGTEILSLNTSNYVDTPRLIASKENEQVKLENVTEGNKSLNMRLSLNTTDSRVSPIIDTQRVSAVLTSNRINNVIADFASDSRVNSIDNDPSACQYISKEIGLTNAATSIKVIVDGYLTTFSDIRAFYATSDKDGFKPVFTPFPGYKNLDSAGRIKRSAYYDNSTGLAAPDIGSNDGRSDSLITPNNEFTQNPDQSEFSSYTFSIDNLSSFRAYRIKFVLTSTSQVHVPRLRNLRVLALA